MEQFLPIILPVLLGEAIEVTYNGQEYLSHKGSFTPIKSLGEHFLNQAVTFKGNLVVFKDRRALPIFQDFETFGRDQMFSSHSEALNFLYSTDLYSSPPFPLPAGVMRIPPLKEIYNWAKELPFYVNAVWAVNDLNRKDIKYLGIPNPSDEVLVKEVVWKMNTPGILTPFLLLENEHYFNEKISNEIDLKSLVHLKSLGIRSNQKILIFGEWIEPLEKATVNWPSRCPKCNTPTKEIGFHLVCQKCHQK